MAKSGCRSRVEVEICASLTWKLCLVPEVSTSSSKVLDYPDNSIPPKQHHWSKGRTFPWMSPGATLSPTWKIMDKQIRDLSDRAHTVSTVKFASITCHFPVCHCPCLKKNFKMKNPGSTATLRIIITSEVM